MLVKSQSLFRLEMHLKKFLNSVPLIKIDIKIAALNYNVGGKICISFY